MRRADVSRRKVSSKIILFCTFSGRLDVRPDEESLGAKYNGIDDEKATPDGFTRPVDRAYWMSNHLRLYISKCEMSVGGNLVPWTSKE